MKLESWKEMISPLDALLKIDPKNIKGRYRKALALYRMDSLLESVSILEELGDDENVQKDEAFHSEVHKLYEAAHTDLNKYQHKEKKIFGKMFE